MGCDFLARVIGSTFFMFITFILIAARRSAVFIHFHLRRRPRGRWPSSCRWCSRRRLHHQSHVAEVFVLAQLGGLLVCRGVPVRHPLQLLVVVLVLLLREVNPLQVVVGDAARLVVGFIVLG